MTLDTADIPLMLLAPAWKKWGECTQVKPGTVLLHSAHDRVVPVVDSYQLIHSSGLSGEALHVVGTEHFLTDDDALLTLLEAVRTAGKDRLLASTH